MNRNAESNKNNLLDIYKMQNLSKNILYFEDVFNNTEKLLKYIEEIEKDNKSYNFITKWKNWTASDNNFLIYGKNKIILTNNIKNKINDNNLNKKVLYIENTIKTTFEICLKQYLKLHNLDLKKYILGIEEIPIKKWIGPGMGPHVDNYDENDSLAFSMIGYLNNNYGGGEIVFPNQDISIKPKAGSLLIFPSGQPYLHKVNEVVFGERHTCHLSVYKKEGVDE